MEKEIGRTIELRGAKYQITSFHPYEENLVNIIRVCNETGKYAGVFWASKVLKKRNPSEKQGVAIWIFKESGRFITM